MSSNEVTPQPISDTAIAQIMASAGLSTYQYRPEDIIGQRFRFDYIDQPDDPINRIPVAMFGKIIGIVFSEENAVTLKLIVSIPSAYVADVVGLLYSKALRWSICLDYPGDGEDGGIEEVPGTFRLF